MKKYDIFILKCLKSNLLMLTIFLNSNILKSFSKVRIDLSENVFV